MDDRREVNAKEFKAKCLDMLDRVGSGEWASVAITKRGKVVAVLVPPLAPPAGVEALHGFMRGSFIIPPGLHLTAPIWGDEPTDAEQGVLHR